MRAALKSWWRERTEREQRLLAVMVALLALVLAWLLLVRPLADELDEAKRRHGEAVTALAQARARAQAPGLAPATEAAAGAPLPIDSHLSRTATEAGFTGARIAAQGPARATFAIDAARAPALFGWVRELEQTGIVVETLRARSNGDRTLAVEAVFRARGQ